MPGARRGRLLFTTFDPFQNSFKIYDLILWLWVLWQKFNLSSMSICTTGRIGIKGKEKRVYHLLPSWPWTHFKAPISSFVNSKWDLPHPARLGRGLIRGPQRYLPRRGWFWNNFVNIKTCVMWVNKLTKLLPSWNKANSFISFTVDSRNAILIQFPSTCFVSPLSSDIHICYMQLHIQIYADYKTHMLYICSDIYKTYVYIYYNPAISNSFYH